MAYAIKIHNNDNVVTVIETVYKGDRIVYAESGGTGEQKAAEDIAIYHKMAVQDIPAGSPAVKYGEIIGVATAFIQAGFSVHVHNLASPPCCADKEIDSNPDFC